MLNLDQLVQAARQENPALLPLLTVSLDGGRFYVMSSKAEELFAMMPDLFFYEKVEDGDWQTLSHLTERDLLFVDTETVDELWELNKITGSQIVLIAEKKLDEALVDYYISEKDLRSAVMSYAAHWQGLLPFRAGFRAMGPTRRPALFLDRDGVVIEYREYPKDVSEVKLTAGISDLIFRAHQKGMAVVVVTNQSGLGRGYYDWKAYDQVTQRMLELLAQEKSYVDQVVKAPFYEKSQLSYGLSRHSLRKPRPGMFHAVVEDLGVDLATSILVGDSASDLMAANLAGVGRAVFLDSPRKDAELQKWRQWPLLSRSKYGLHIPILSRLSELVLD